MKDQEKMMQQIEGWHGILNEKNLVDKMQVLDSPYAFVAFLGAFSDLWCDMHGYDSDEIRQEVVRIGKMVKEMQKEDMPTAIWIIPGKEGGEKNDLQQD